MRIEHELVIKAPIERVWELTIGIESWPGITPTTITSVQRLDDGPLQTGSRTRLKQPGQRATIWTVTVVEPPHTFAWQARTLGVTMTATHTLTSSGPGTTTNRLAIDIDGPLALVLGGMFRRKIRQVLATENESFKATAESPTTAGRPGRTGA